MYPLPGTNDARRAGQDHGRRRLPVRLRRRLAGALVSPGVTERVTAVLDAVGGEGVQVGFHGHENLACGVANTLAAIDAGAAQVDASTRRMGAGAGNTPTEALAAVLEKLGIETAINVAAIADAAEGIIRPIMNRDACSTGCR